MFSSFSSYLFGSGNNCIVPNGKENELVTVETEGDWLLVEQYRRGSSFDLGEEENQPPCPVSDCNLPTNGALTVCTTATATATALSMMRHPPSLPSSPTPIACLEGSWYITPPPCFTAGSPCHVLTSPLENLLIEHPSMSVYASIDGTSSASHILKERQRSAPPSAQDDVQGQTVVISVSDAGNIEGLERVSDVAKNGGRSIRSGGSRQPSVLLNKPGLLEQIQNQADVQKVQQRQQTKLVHRKQLERLNKAQEFQSLGKRQRRKDFMKSPSGKSNNRKY